MIKTIPAKLFGLFFTFSVTASALYAQKAPKYKDIYTLLSTRQYEQAEPFLKRFLATEDDEPNAYLYSGIIYSERAGKIDVLKQRDVALSLMDSALIYFDKARASIDERELRKRKDYYEIYNRRDLRTGEFGIKLSDVQLDIDKRMENLRLRSTNVKGAYRHFNRADSLYKVAQAYYKSLREQFDSQRELYLRADERTLADLRSMALAFDSCRVAFETYRKVGLTITNFSYRQEFEPREIKVFEQEGLTPADFFSNKPEIWNYKLFGDQAVVVIERDIIPMRSHLVSYDIEINKLRDRLERDSVSVRSELTRIIDRLLQDQLKKYDPNPLPLELFNAKIADLDYRSLKAEHRALRDSANATLQVDLAGQELKSISRLDSIVDRLNSTDLERRILDYRKFVEDAYGNATVMQGFVRTLAEHVEHEKALQAERLATVTESLKWIVDGTDSIPLVAPVAGNAFKVLTTEPERFTVGLQFTDSLHATGYFYTITPSRRPEVKVKFPVEKSGFTEGKLAATSALTSVDPGGQIFFVLVYLARPGAKPNATLAKIYRSDGLSWASPLALNFVPSQLRVKPDTGEISVSGEAGEVLVDKNGKVVK